MESKELVYKYGHFYDKFTDNRIELRDGANIQILVSANDFIPAPAVGKLPDVLLNPELKATEVNNERDLKTCKKLKDKGSFLFFTIHRKENGHNFSYEFKVELLEDLYVYLKNKWDKDKLYDCACTVKAVVSGNIRYFEEIKAKSLNEVFKTTYVHYFGNEGNPACNALDRFYEHPGNEATTIGENRIVK